MGHPAPGVYDQPSVAALVASYDTQGMKYNAYTTIQPPRLETIEQLQYMVQVSVSQNHLVGLTEISKLLIREPLMILARSMAEEPRDLYFSVMDCPRVNMSRSQRRRSRRSKVSSASLLRAQLTVFSPSCY